MGKSWHRIFYLLPIGIAFLWVLIFPNELRFTEPRVLIPGTSLLVLVSIPFIGYTYSWLKRKAQKPLNLWLMAFQLLSLCGSILALTWMDEFFANPAQLLYNEATLHTPGLNPYSLRTELPFGLSFSIDIKNQFTFIRKLWIWWTVSATVPIMLQWVLFKLKRKSIAAV